MRDTEKKQKIEVAGIRNGGVGLALNPVFVNPSDRPVADGLAAFHKGRPVARGRGFTVVEGTDERPVVICGNFWQPCLK